MRTRRSQSSSDPVSSDTSGHRTVLLHEAVTALAIKAGDTVVDATLGGAGHSRLIADALGSNGTLVGFDADAGAIERARRVLATVACSVVLAHANFRDLERELRTRGIERINGILFDLGWSGFQLAAGRGFSFRADEPLSMVYDERQQLTAATIVNDWSEPSLADVIYGWGEERHARRIAKAIVEARTKQPIRTAHELATIIERVVPRRGPTHPATKTFQALRIAVNDELGALEVALRAARSVLAPGGRCAVITFHSIEDRVVKRLFRSWEDEGVGLRVTKRPMTPTNAEVEMNPRSRSAKLRVFEINK